MATLIGVVSQVVGEVFAVASDGLRRPISEGDRVYAGEQLVTGASGAVAVTMTNGQQLTLGRDSSMTLDAQMLAYRGESQAPVAEAPPAAPSDADLTDVERLQAAIEAGVDPTLEGEATAAGPGAGGGAGGAGGGHSFVLLDEVGGALDPVIGFPTAGLPGGPEFPEGEPIVTPDPVPPAIIGFPSAGQSSNAVDEDGLPGGIAGGPNDLAGEDTVVTGSLGYSFGPNGIGSFAWSTDGLSALGITSQGVPLVYSVSADGFTLSAFAGDVLVFTLQLTDLSTGTYQFSIFAPLDHPAPLPGGSDENDLFFLFNYVITDGIGNSATGSLTLGVNDDTPELAGVPGARPVVEGLVHEDALSNGNPEGAQQTVTVFGGAGTLDALVNFGADGRGSFSLDGSAAALESLTNQGLSSGGVPLTYAVSADGSTLTASAGGNVIFTLVVNSDGSFLFTLQGPLDHPRADGDDSETLGDSSLRLDFSGLLIATDGDGDAVVGGFAAGSFVIDVEDDVPVQAGENGEGPRVVGLVHEDALTPGNAEGNDQVLSVSGGAGTLDALVNFGADGRGGFQLSTEPGALTALQNLGLTSGGVALSYAVSADGTTLTATAGAKTIFTLTVGTDGSYEFLLQGPLDHPLQNGDDSETLGGSNLVLDFSGVLIATDGDGDPIAGGFQAGSFVIDVEDDVPVQAGENGEGPRVVGLVHEDALTPGNAEGNDQVLSVSGGAGTLDALVNFGADGRGGFQLSTEPGALTALQNLGLTSGGVALSYAVSADGNTLTATAGAKTIFTLTVGTDGSYEFLLQGPLDHPLQNGDDSETLGGSNLVLDFSGVLIATDGDGDPIAGGFQAGSFVIDVEDDVPVQAGENGEGPRVVGLVHEDALTPGNAEGNDQVLSVSGGAGTLDALVNFGADGRGGFQLSTEPGALTALQNLGLTSGGVALSYAVSADGTTLTATAGAKTIFTLTVGTDGSYEFLLQGPLDHPLQNGDDSETLGGSNLVLDFSGVLIATDGDGDPIAGGFQAGSFVIDVEDDVPVLKPVDPQRPALGGTVHEDLLSLPHTGNPDNGGQTLVVSTAGGAGNLSSLVSFGADGPGAFGLVESSVAKGLLDAQGLTSGGEGLVYEMVPTIVDGKLVSSTLTAVSAESLGSYPVFTLTVNADGSFHFELQGPIDHPVKDGDDDELWSNGGVFGIDFTQLITATDGDGDPLQMPVDAGGLFVINVQDDVPELVDGANGHSLTLTYKGGDASYFNSYGYYIKGPDGIPLSGQIVWGNTTNLSGGDSITLHGLDPSQVGFFIIPNGGLNGAVSNAEVTFQIVNGQWKAFIGDTPINGAGGAHVLFDNPALNPAEKSHVQDNAAPGNQNWEDVNNLNSDNDYNDVNIQATWSGKLGGTVHEDKLQTPNQGNQESGQTLVVSTATGAGTLASLVAFGADGPGVFKLVETDAAIALLSPQGLKAGGEALSYVVSEQMVDGQPASVLVATAAGGYPVFELTVYANGDFKFELKGPIDHPLADGNDSELWSSNGYFGIDFTQLLKITDGDGDPLLLPKGLGGLFVINIEDDVPTLGVDALADAARLLKVALDETVGDQDRYAANDSDDGYVNDDAANALAQVQTNVLGGLVSLFSISGSYGADGEGTTVGSMIFVGVPQGGLLTNLQATDGGAIKLVPAGSDTLNGIDTQGHTVFTIKIVEVGGGELQLQTTLFEAIRHGDNDGRFDESIDLLITAGGPLQLLYQVTRTDADGDPVTASGRVTLADGKSSVFSFDDDGPQQTVEVCLTADLAGLKVSLDETVGASDRYAAGESEVGEAYSQTDSNTPPPHLARSVTSIEGGLTALFKAVGDYGSDGQGSLSGQLSFVGFPALGGLATTLFSTAGGAITLYLEGDAVVGRDANGGDPVLRIELVQVNGQPQLQTTLYEAIRHGDNSTFDESVDLLLTGQNSLGLRYEVVRVDGDGDEVRASADISLANANSSMFSFDDDGPQQTVEVCLTADLAGLKVSLDETVGASDRYAAGESEVGEAYSQTDSNTPPPHLARSVTSIEGGLTALFKAVGDYGSDGQGSLSGQLSFVGFPALGGLATTLFSTAGGAITLYLEGDAVVGRDANGGDPVLRIELVQVNGQPQLQTTLYEAIRHGDNSTFDESVDLLLTGQNSLGLRYEVVRVDGDGDEVRASADISLANANSSMFSFDDDGPQQTVEVCLTADLAGLKVSLDETVGASDRYAAGESEVGEAYSQTDSNTPPPHLARSVTSIEGGLTALFKAVGDYGSDGQGSLSGQLSFVGFPALGGLATTLFSTAGGAITLYLEGDAVVGRDANGGDPVLRIELVQVNGQPQLQTTLYEAIRHGDNSTFDESVDLLLTGQNSLGLRYEVVRVDGDGDEVRASADISLANANSSMFSFDDDGPQQTVEVCLTADLAGLKVSLDETVGASDRYAAGESEVGEAYSQTDSNTPPPHLARSVTSIEGGLTALFKAVGDYGSDGQGSLTGQLSFVGFPAIGGLATTLSSTAGGAITLYLEGDAVVGRDANGGDPVLRIELVQVNGQPQLQTTLYEAIRHGDNSTFDESVDLLLTGQNSLGLRYEVVRVDGDGDEVRASADISLANANSSMFSFDDDGPVLLSEPECLQAAEISGLIVSGQLQVDFGSDGFGAFDLSGSQPPEGSGLIYTVQPGNDGSSTLTATTSSGDVFFILTVKADGSYTFELVNARPVTTVEYDFRQISAGGPTPSFTLTGADGFSLTISGTDGNANNDPDNVNPSNQGLGVNNNLIKGSDVVTLKFSEEVYNATLLIDKFRAQNLNNADKLTWKAYDADGNLLAQGTYSPPVGTGENEVTTFNLLSHAQFDTGYSAADLAGGFNELRFGAANGDYRILTLEVERQFLPPDLQLQFKLSMTDGDGDPLHTVLDVCFVDATPVIFQVDEDELAGGNSDYDGVGTQAAGSIASLLFGESPSVSWSDDTSSLPNLTSGGKPVVYEVDGIQLLATAGGLRSLP
ncbi:retention module-containing protein [Ectopseudomonas hydrolytica]|uniref:retention module-containing protein n=1 Tax=Ectopseudomonas hydrolytica TaxID=2493633 RepID=UPI003EDF1C67